MVQPAGEERNCSLHSKEKAVCVSVHSQVCYYIV